MRCAICGSGRLSPVGELRATEKRRDCLRLMFPRPGILKVRPTFDAYLARACRDCGALFPFLGEHERQQLDAAADDLNDAEVAPPAPRVAADGPGPAGHTPD